MIRDNWLLEDNVVSIYRMNIYLLIYICFTILFTFEIYEIMSMCDLIINILFHAFSNLFIVYLYIIPNSSTVEFISDESLALIY